MSDQPVQEKQKHDEQEKQYTTEWSFSFGDLGDKIGEFVKSLGVSGEEVIVTETFTEPVGDASRARIDLHTPVGRTNVHAGAADTLVHAVITHVGEVQFATTGTTEKQVTISQRTDPSSWMRGIFSWIGSTGKLRWDVALSPAVPVELDIHSGVGECQYDLSALQLTALNIHGGTGEMNVTLPTTSELLRAVVNGGVGEVNIRIPAGASVELQARAGTGEIDIEIGSGAAVNAQIKGGVGETKVRVPAGAAVRVTANMGVGDIDVPSDFVTVRGAAGGGIGRSGVWQTADFETAATKIDIRFDGGVGALKIWR
jgi:hypothetical protein